MSRHAFASNFSGRHGWRESCSSSAGHFYRPRETMTLTHIRCPYCHGKNVEEQSTYTIKCGAPRTMYYCSSCERAFSETSSPPIAHLKTPIALVVQVLTALTEGVGINAATRLYGVSKHSIYRWQERLSSLKKTLLLFALTHQFLQQLIEGDELYTRVQKKVTPNESQGWTVVLMDRATRFLWDMHCGRKERKMFQKAMGLLCQVIEQTGALTLLTDGERRYGNLLFALCSQALRTGKRG